MKPTDWHTDLDALAAEITARHRDPFHAVSRERFDRAVADLHDRIPGLTDTAVMVGLDALAALIGDGHTRVATDAHYRRFPLDLFWYGDELRVLRAATADPRIAGTRVTAIGGVPVAEADRRVRTVVAHGENDWYELAASADRLTRADVLAALGVLPGTDSGAFTLAADDGTAFTAEIPALPAGTAPDWPAPAPDAPVRHRLPGEALALTPLPDADAAYVNFRHYGTMDDDAPRLLDRLHALAPRRLVLDLRDNSGGDYTLARHHLVYPIWHLAGVNRPGGLYVLIGRRTFSAAMVTATDFHRETEALLVGEPTGARPVAYQETGAFTLPRSGLHAQCAIRRYRFSDTDRPAVLPDHRVDPDFAAERAGGDPALDWCLARPA